MFWCNFGRRTQLIHFVRASLRQCSNTASASTSTTASEVKELYVRNVFRDNPSAKYYLLTFVTVTAGTAYYVYNNQQKKKFILNVLPPAPNHHTVSWDSEVDKLTSLLENNRFHQVQISGPRGSGKTQIARLLAERLNETRKDSFQFKIWPKDEVTGTLYAQSKESLLASLKQLAGKLGCEQDEVKLEGHDLEHQLDVFSQAVKEKLKQKQCWILVVDNNDESISLKKWLPDIDWGNGYVIHTVNSQTVAVLGNESQYSNFSVNQMTNKVAGQIFSCMTTQTTDDLEIQREPPECLLNLLQYNPLSVACAAIYYNHQVEQNKKYNHDNLYADISQAVKQLEETDPDLNKLQAIQTGSVTLATKALGQRSPELLHVFDLLGSCSASDPIPVFLFSHHLKTPEYHVQLMKPKEAPEEIARNEDTSLSVNATMEQEHNLWSFRGIVDRTVKIYERIKLEMDAIKGLFGYGEAAVGVKSEPASDGLEVIRSCPLFNVSYEPMSGIEVVTVHPIVHKVLRQVFVNVTIPLLEQQHLVLAERKHRHKSYFARLRTFDPQSSIAEYRRDLGDIASLKDTDDFNEKNLVLENTQVCVNTILRGTNGIVSVQTQNLQHTFAHLQEHLSRVVNSLSNHYNIAGGDSNVLVARTMLLPHLEALLQERCLTAASKALVYRTMSNIQSQVFGDCATAMRLLNMAYAVTKDRYGEDSLEIAGIITEQAELCSTREELDRSKVLLERAIEIYQKNIKISQRNKQPFEYGKALVALGVTCGSLGEASRSKDLLEKGLMELQNAAPDNPHAKENKWFAAEISTAVTSLGHAYLSLGKISQGRKLLELALIGHQNVHGDAHDEVIRTLTTLSIAHAMQGNSQESKRLRNEAGKIRKKLDKEAPLFLHSSTFY